MEVPLKKALHVYFFPQLHASMHFSNNDMNELASPTCWARDPMVREIEGHGVNIIGIEFDCHVLQRDRLKSKRYMKIRDRIDPKKKISVSINKESQSKPLRTSIDTT